MRFRNFEKSVLRFEMTEKFEKTHDFSGFHAHRMRVVNDLFFGIQTRNR